MNEEWYECVSYLICMKSLSILYKSTRKIYNFEFRTIIYKTFSYTDGSWIYVKYCKDFLEFDAFERNVSSHFIMKS